MYPFRRCSSGVPFQEVLLWCPISGLFLSCTPLEGVLGVYLFRGCMCGVPFQEAFSWWNLSGNILEVYPFRRCFCGAPFWEVFLRCAL